MDEKKQNKGVSRRGFLKGAGLTTAGTVMINTSLLAFDLEEKPAIGKEYGPEAIRIEMKVNGDVHSLIVEPRTTLASALRDHLGLTGTKIVCDRGSCSACTVKVGGKLVNSCLTLAMDVGGKEVITIEGISKNGELHPVQEAFIEHDASQCGYCTPGFIMSCTELLENNKFPSLEDVKEATRGHLCRCGTYPHVFKATLNAAKKMK
jgi:aerobic-type carbon monoxide dehydrogenase small subunit (CoxS/CutS family)